jgi:transcriptional regulator with XRE-family HTH domain
MAAEGRVIGDHLRWAREIQNLTMRDVRRRGGPAAGYQSEVETGQKEEVSSEMLAAWSKALGVTVAYARGQVPKFKQEDHGPCRGLAGWVEPIIRKQLAEFQQPFMDPQDRVRAVLRLISESEELPPVVLAWILSMSPQGLREIIAGNQRVLPHVRQAVAVLAALPHYFFEIGMLDEPEPEAYALLIKFRPALHKAERAGLTCTDLIRRIESD